MNHPKIRGAIEEPEKKLVSFSITRVEKSVLFRKYTSLGYPSWEADRKIKSFCDYLKELRIKLNHNKKLTEDDINERFKKEFEKLCLKLDGERE